MANLKTSQFPNAATLTGTETVGIVQNGNNVACTLNSVLGIAPPLLQMARVVLSPAQLLALYTTPVEIVPAPAASQYVFVHRAVASIDYNSVPYSGSTTFLQLNYGPTISLQSPAYASFSATLTTATQSSVDILAPSSLQHNSASIVGQGIYVTSLSALTNGNSQMAVVVYYTIETP